MAGGRLNRFVMRLCFDIPSICSVGKRLAICSFDVHERKRIGHRSFPPKQTERRIMAPKTVGMIGLGIMGSAMSTNLIRAGFKVVGYDVLARRRQDHRKIGGSVVRSCREVGRNSAIIVTSLPSSEALLDTAAQLAESARSNQIVIETSTLSISVKEEAARRGARSDAIGLPVERYWCASTHKGSNRLCQWQPRSLSSRRLGNGRLCACALLHREVWFGPR